MTMTEEPTQLTNVTDTDLTLVERELGQTSAPRSTRDLTAKLAFEKTATERTQDVKIYDPDVRYEVGDTIEKTYNEPLTVGSKSVEHFEGRVILKVVAKSYSISTARCSRSTIPEAGSSASTSTT
jgi:hypothetical protein